MIDLNTLALNQGGVFFTKLTQQSNSQSTNATLIWENISDVRGNTQNLLQPHFVSENTGY